jgi:hypothetical protein
MASSPFPPILDPANYDLSIDGPTFTELFQKAVDDAGPDSDAVDSTILDALANLAELETETGASLLDLPDLADMAAALDTTEVGALADELPGVIQVGDTLLGDVTALAPTEEPPPTEPPSAPPPAPPTAPSPGLPPGGPTNPPPPVDPCATGPAGGIDPTVPFSPDPCGPPGITW